MALPAGSILTPQRLLDNIPRTISYTANTANTSTATGTELVAITTSSVTFRAGRAYRVIFKGLAQSSAAGDTVTVRVRKTNTSGSIYLDSFRLYVAVAATNTPFYLGNICTNTTSADVSAVLVGTYVRVGGSGNVLLAATGTHVSYIEVQDIGDATDYANATAIT